MRFSHLLLTLALPASLLGQQPNLSGRWVLNEAESQYPGPRPDGARTYIPSQELTISVDGVSITLDTTSIRTLVAERIRDPRGSSIIVLLVYEKVI